MGIKTLVAIVSDYNLAEDQWVQCAGSYLKDHEMMMKQNKHCSRCGDATEVTFKKGERITLYLKGKAIQRIDIGNVCHILGY